MTEPLKCRGVSRDGENPHAAIVYFDRELTQDELRTLHENLSQPASPGNTDPMTIAKYDDELRKASPAPVWRDVPISTSERLPEKPGKRSYEHVRCLIFVFGEWQIGMWNCEHLVWDDEYGDDFRYEPTEPTHWTSLPAAPGSQPTEQPPQASALLYDHIPKQDAKLPPQAEPTARDALQAIADIPPFNTIMYGAEAAYRAVEALFDTPPEIHVSEQPPQADVQVDKSTGEICTPPIRSTDANGDELVTFTSANTLADIARWIAENQTDAEEVIRILTDMTTVRALAGEE